MTEQEIIDGLETHANLLEDLMEADDTTDVSGYKSVRKIVKENINKLGRAFSTLKEYFTGDIVSYNKKLFLANKYGIDKNPDIETEFWDRKDSDIIAGTAGFSKKILFRNGNIVNGKEYVSRIVKTENDNDIIYSIYFSEQCLNPNYIVIPSTGALNGGSRFYLGITNKTNYSFDLYLKKHTDYSLEEISLFIKEV